MEFGPGFWGPVIATAVMLFGAAIGYLMLALSRRYLVPKPSPEKLRTYACGEVLKPEEMHVDSEQFYSAMRRAFKPFYKYVQPKHTGILSTYLLWVVVGFILILIAIAVALR
jgi:hypothetical protein